ncbi:protein kinase [Myxococcus sp. K38C18041901]|uniref:protein kinase domain-containing protein n=1 Tax=Myxococcus guangdongensis TaxID=2906760 RepID=UPI0020A764D5|nr:protein kinase [Myxococcus guangdongensis]MCP3061158.1 protein kinase [Myxococcus guangdongensis]
MFQVGDISASTVPTLAELIATRIGYPAGAESLEAALTELVKVSENVSLSDLVKAVQGLHGVTALKLRKSAFFVEHQAPRQQEDLGARPEQPPPQEVSAKTSLGLPPGLTFVKIQGQGGFGMVMQARTQDGEIVIVKQLQTVEEAQHEERVMRALNHPNIPKVRSRHQAFLAMDFVVGDDLKSEIPMQPQRIYQVGLAVLETLAYMHQNNYVHGDIKPANVMLTTTGRFMLIDFGESKTIGGNHSRVEADIRMFGNLLRRLMLGNEVSDEEEWPTWVPLIQRRLIDRCRQKFGTQPDLREIVRVLTTFSVPLQVD